MAGSSAGSSQETEGEFRARGITTPIRDATLGSPVAGIIGEQHFAEGDLVEKGQVIVELRHQLEEIEVARRQTIMAASKRDLDRTTTLFKSTRSVSVEKMEEVQSNYEIARSEYEIAAEQLKVRQIAAPFSGRVTYLYELEEGESVQIQTPLARLVDTTRCYFIAHVGSRLIHGLEKGAEVVLEFDTGAGLIQRPAQITLVSSVIDPSSGLLKVRAEFDNHEGSIRAGLDGEMVWMRGATVGDAVDAGGKD